MPELKYFMYMTSRTGILKFVKFMSLGSCMGPHQGVKVHHVQKFTFSSSIHELLSKFQANKVKSIIW